MGLMLGSGFFWVQQAAAAGPGDVVINEIMQNPNAVSDTNGEWFELFNTTGDPIDINGWTIQDNDIDSHDIDNGGPLVIPAGGFLVLGNNSDSDTNGGVTAGYEYSDISLVNGADELVLLDDNMTEIDRVEWDGGPNFPDPIGAAMALIDPALDNNVGANWCTAVTPYGAGDDGTPGAANDCDGAPPPPEEFTIMEIQGDGHVSPVVGKLLQTIGIVTAVGSNGFYMQDPVGDDDDTTSDGIFVFSGSAPDVAIGDEVEVKGNVAEFQPGGSTTNNLTITEMTNPSITVLSSGNPLPAPVLIGKDGRKPPTEVIDSDFADAYNPQTEGVFDPEQDGLDFYETLEGMQVTVKYAVAVSPTNRFGEIVAVAEGTNPTGLSKRGTLNISPDDFNPERIQIDDDPTFSPMPTPLVNVGDRLGDVTGVVSYSFGNFEILFTEEFTPQSAGLKPEKTKLFGFFGPTIASFNVLNLDPNDEDGDADVANGRFDAIAEIIVKNLRRPDIVALQEIQDNDGSMMSDIITADETLRLLVDKISEIGRVRYQFIDNPFIGNNTSGGQPGGNIRTAFLYNPRRVTLIKGSVQTVTDPMDQQNNPENPFFDSRLPLVASFTVGWGDDDDDKGNVVTIVNNHFSSKGGSSPLFGLIQPSIGLQEDPSVNGGVNIRTAQAETVKDFVDGILAQKRKANIVVLGDFNEFEFISPLKILEESLINLTKRLPENERYTFIFEGNSQSLDHILVSKSLKRGAWFDIAHVNSEFAETPKRASDHDPLIARIKLNSYKKDDD
jgi:predicted extracellular nuclease